MNFIDHEYEKNEFDDWEYFNYEKYSKIIFDSTLNSDLLINKEPLIIYMRCLTQLRALSSLKNPCLLYFKS